MATLRVSKSGDPGEEGPKLIKSTKVNAPADDLADIRDFLSFTVGGKYKSFSDNEIKAVYGRLAQRVGAPVAQKLMTRAFLYNQNPDNATLPTLERMSAFYNNVGDDPEVAKILTNVRGFGQGVKEGAINSAMYGTRELAGNSVVPTIDKSAPVTTMLRVRK